MTGVLSTALLASADAAGHVSATERQQRLIKLEADLTRPAMADPRTVHDRELLTGTADEE